MEHRTRQIDFKSGAKGLLIDVPGSKVVNLIAGFNSGQIFCFNDVSPELSHVMEHVMVGANTAYKTRLEYETEVEKNGAYVNAATSTYFNWYEHECAAFEASRINKLLAAQLRGPLFLDNEVTTEISNVREELNSYLSNYDRLVYDAFFSGALGHPGLQDSLDTLHLLGPDALRSYYERTHSDANMRFVFAGNLPKGIEVDFEAEMAGQPSGERLPIPGEVPKQLDAPIMLHHDIPQVYYLFGQFSGPVDYDDQHILPLLTVILTGRYNSWILGEARERGLAYHVQSSIDNTPSYSLLSIGAFATPANIGELFELIARKLRELLAGELKAQELEDAKELLVGRRLRRFKTPGDLIDWYFFDFFAYDKVTDFEHGIELLKSVTVDDVMRLAQHLLGTPRWSLAMVGDLPEGRAHDLHGKLATIWG